MLAAFVGTVTAKRVRCSARSDRGRIGGGEAVGARGQDRCREAPGTAAARDRGSESARPPSDTVTVEPAIAVPVRLTESFGFTTPWLMVGTATFGLAVSLFVTVSLWTG